ncbi:uncharacterized protein LOC120321226 [Drosophila yakuba]|uniref:uncharacterized protein LOC120321226 n=1 Tax=Drosophila yakuba TaxID=7245 RepID=UPI0019307ACA|nr:uncharacterized protein LOC120321226 [Drosophila yakuba]
MILLAVPLLRQFLLLGQTYTACCSRRYSGHRIYDAPLLRRHTLPDPPVNGASNPNAGLPDWWTWAACCSSPCRASARCRFWPCRDYCCRIRTKRRENLSVQDNLPDPDRGVGSSENAERLLLQSLFLLLLTLYAVPAAR